MTHSKSKALQLTPDQVFVLGRMLEIQFSAPDHYPCPVDTLASACEEPPVNPELTPLERSETNQAITKLIRAGLLKVDHGASEFSYRHLLAESLRLGPAQLALITNLILNGAQTLEELLDSSQRFYPFQDYLHVAETLNSLRKKRPFPLIQSLPKTRADQKLHYHHCFFPAPPVATQPAEGEADTDLTASDSQQMKTLKPRDRIDELESRVAELENIIEKLMGPDPLDEL